MAYLTLPSFANGGQMGKRQQSQAAVNTKSMIDFYKDAQKLHMNKSRLSASNRQLHGKASAASSSAFYSSEQPARITNYRDSKVMRKLTEQGTEDTSMRITTTQAFDLKLLGRQNPPTISEELKIPPSIGNTGRTFDQPRRAKLKKAKEIFRSALAK